MRWKSIAILVDTRPVTASQREDQPFGNHLKWLRLARGLTQDELGWRSDLSPHTIRRLEHGSFSPSLETLRKLCKGMSLSLSTMFSSFEMGEIEGARELADLLATRSPRDYRLAHRVLVSLFDALDDMPPVVRDELDETPSDVSLGRRRRARARPGLRGEALARGPAHRDRGS